MDDGDAVSLLEFYCGSWVATKDGYIFETFEYKTAVRAAALGWKVETTAQYLSIVNREIRKRDDTIQQ